MSIRGSDDEHNIYISVQNSVWIGNKVNAGTASLKTLPGFFTPRAYWPHLRHTAGNQAIENLKISPDHISSADDEIVSLSSSLDLKLTEIGTIERGAGVRLVDGDGGEILIGMPGWRHF